MKTILLHGLNSTGNTFNYICSQIDSDFKIVEYDSFGGLVDILKYIKTQLPSEEINIIGHSLGGVIGYLLSIDSRVSVKKLITISSPLGGSKSAMFLQPFIHGVKTLKDITPTSSFISEIKKDTSKSNVSCIVSTKGYYSVFIEPNDGVVSVASQSFLKRRERLFVDTNHFEVLLHPTTISFLKMKLQK